MVWRSVAGRAAQSAVTMVWKRADKLVVLWVVRLVSTRAASTVGQSVVRTVGQSVVETVGQSVDGKAA